MAVVGLALGGIAIGAVIYDNHSDYSDYSDYDDYSNYSDAAERRQRRIEAKKNEISSKKSDINTYKTNSVNDYLQSAALIRQSGVEVSVEEVRRDGNSKIEDAIKANLSREGAGLIAVEINDINEVLNKINDILEEGE